MYDEVGNTLKVRVTVDEADEHMLSGVIGCCGKRKWAKGF